MKTIKKLDQAFYIQVITRSNFIRDFELSFLLLALNSPLLSTNSDNTIIQKFFSNNLAANIRNIRGQRASDSLADNTT